MKFQHRHLQPSPSRAALLLLAALSLLAPLTLPDAAFAQDRQFERNDSHSTRSNESSPRAGLEIVERAMSAVCSERKVDPLGSVPIDEMQASPSLPLKHPEAVAGARRATRLLPVAKELAAAALRQLGNEHNIDARKIAAAARRIQAVREIEADVDLRDNASVTLSDPYTISFGTIFLAGLPSNEGMVSVIAHELTHMADGKEDTLYWLFRHIGRRAAHLTGMHISGRRTEELTADLVGALAARSFIERTPNEEPLKRRLARLVEHNCVDEDETDDDHLSPLNTMRALLALDTALTYNVAGIEYTPASAPPAPPTITRRQTRRGRQRSTRRLRRTRGTSLTTTRTPSYHHRFR